MPERLLTVKEVAKTLNVSEMFVWKRIWDKRIKSVKLGKAVRITADELDRIIEEGINGQKP